VTTFVTTALGGLERITFATRGKVSSTNARNDRSSDGAGRVSA